MGKRSGQADPRPQAGQDLLAVQREEPLLVVVPPNGLYGLGIFRARVLKAGKTINFYGHNGIVPGYDSMALYSPARKITIVVLGNTSVGFDKFFRNYPKRTPDPDLFKAFGSLACIALHPDVSPHARCALNQQ